METRNVLFTDADNTSIRIVLELPGNVLNPPKYLQRCGKLYGYKGSGLSGKCTVNFYREVNAFLSLD